MKKPVVYNGTGPAIQEASEMLAAARSEMMPHNRGRSYFRPESDHHHQSDHDHYTANISQI